MTSVAPSQTAPFESTNTGYSKTSRRQYQSCDQCRKSRRACDAAIVRVASFPFRVDCEDIDPSAPTCDACSNCARTSKKCTFDWLRTLPLQGLPKGVKRKLETNGAQPSSSFISDSSSDTNYQQAYHRDSSLLSHADVAVSSQFEAPPSDCRHFSDKLDHDNLGQFNSSTYPSTMASNTNGYPLLPEMQYLQQVNRINVVPPAQASATAAFPPPLLPTESSTQIGWSTGQFLTRHDTASSSSSESIDSQTADSQTKPPESLTSNSSDFSRENDRASSTHRPKQPKHTLRPTDYSDNVSVDRSSSTSTYSRGPSISSALSSNGRRPSSTPLSPRQVRFANDAMKSMIATGLLRIYHDSFENSLSCWVTEKNCPYETELGDAVFQTPPGSTAEEAAIRLSDNRIFSRVSRLDSAFARLRGRELTSTENRCASKALNAAIMAFASQWSHSSHNAFWRSKEGMSQMKAWQNQPGNMPPPPGRSNDPMLSSECERMIQKTLWHEARTAIQGSAEVDSFKVILAYMIFALTQRPIDECHKAASAPPSSATGDSSAKGRRGSENPSVDEGFAQFPDPAMDAIANEEWNPFHANDLEALASPPIYLETAVRNLFSWRRKVERYRRLRSKVQATNGHDAIGGLTLKDQQTFNILFWLGVMCDTTSSAISKRPLVIPDEDCSMIREPGTPVNQGRDRVVGLDWSGHSAGHERLNGEPEDEAGALWGNYLLGFKWAGPRDTQPRWPCSFSEAALVLQEAIPVKVLMFRKVGQLQTLSYRRSPPGALERCINEAHAVYQHWTTTYGLFMEDCVNEHNNLPPHVQSWYVILDGHWHYGCLLLADTIAQVDREEKTLAPQRELRAKCQFLAELRRQNAGAISRIAQASLSEHAPSIPNNPEFHYACNGSAILTEPWTDILVRAMGTACKIFITWLVIWDSPADPLYGWVRANTSYNDLYAQAQACIHGMTLLGRKSDAANRTAEVFWTRLSRVYSERQHRGEPVKDEDAVLDHEFLAQLPEMKFFSTSNPMLAGI